MKTHKGRCLGLTVLDIRPFIVLTGGVGALLTSSCQVRILICVNGVLKHVNTPDSYLRERCANIGDSVRSLA